MVDSRNKVQIKLAGLKRHLIWSFLSKQYNMVLVTEFPKSGGSWLAQMLAVYLGIPFRRSESAKFEHCLMHGHYLPNTAMNNPIAVMRDGRDVSVSYYHHMILGNDQMPKYSATVAQQKLGFSDIHDIESNMPKFIEYLFTDYASKKGFMYFTWVEFGESVLQGKYKYIKYEDMNRDPQTVLIEALKHINPEVDIDMNRLQDTVESLSFKAQSGRTAGAEEPSSYLRKGIVGDWKHYFSKESVEVFNHYAGDCLIKFDYEKSPE